MSVSSHVHQLREKHEALSKLIEDELQHPGADELRIKALKREKLQIKDEIARLDQANG